jgi:hypothetical protein
MRVIFSFSCVYGLSEPFRCERGGLKWGIRRVYKRTWSRSLELFFLGGLCFQASLGLGFVEVLPLDRVLVPRSGFSLGTRENLSVEVKL